MRLHVTLPSVVFAGVALLAVPRVAVADIVLSEVMADNESFLADEDGEFSDWLELHNNGATAVALGGMFLTDDAGDLTGWQFEPMSLGAGEFLVIFASKKDRSDPAGELHTDFRLGDHGEYLGLVAPDGVTVISEFAPTYLPLENNISFGRGAGGDELGLLREPTPGEANAPIAIPPQILSFTVDNAEIPFGGSVTFSWEAANVPTVRLSNGLNNLPPVGSLVVEPRSSSRYTLSVFNGAGFDSASIDIAVGPHIDTLTANPPTIVPGGRTVLRWNVLEEETVSLGDGFGNALQSPLVYTPFNEALVAAGSTWSFLADGSDQGVTWRDPGFDDAAWPSGAGSLGFGSDEVATVIPKNGITTYYRQAFDVADPAELRGLTLRMRADAGALAYLNGEEIARYRLPEGAPINANTPGRRLSSGAAERAYIEHRIDPAMLSDGANVLAVEMHLESISEPWLLFDAGLTAWRSSGAGNETHTMTLAASDEVGSVSENVLVTVTDDLDPPAPPELIISEFFWGQAGAHIPRPLQFIEIHNAGDSAVGDLSAGVQLIGAMSFDFANSADPVLEPGAFALVVADPDEFGAFWGQGLPVVGTFTWGDSFAQGVYFGLLAADGQLIERFADDLPLADGIHSFSRIDYEAAPDFPENWQLSVGGGSPGEREAPRILRFDTGAAPRARAGDRVTLMFEVQGAVSAQIEPDVGEIPVGVLGSAEVIIPPGSNQTYTLTAFSEFSNVLRTVEIVVQPQILSFIAEPAVVRPGEAVRLFWNVVGEDTWTSIGPGIASGVTNGFTFVPLENTIIAENSEWRYLNDGSDQGMAWREVGFDDSAWSGGFGSFGYGNQIEQTILEQGHASNYFRKTFTVDDPADHVSVFADLKIDDGAHVFINGAETLRVNLPAGDINYLTLSDGPSPDDGRRFQTFAIDPERLVAGENLIAVSGHNNIPGSDDFGFDLRLRGIGRSETGFETFTLRVANGGVAETASVTVRIGEPGASQFRDWADEQGLPPGAGTFSDGDGDGLTDLFEFALGSDPTVPDVANPLQFEVEGGHLVLKHPFNPSAMYVGARGVRLGIETSEVLQNWDLVSGELQFLSTTATADPEVMESTYRSLLPLGHPLATTRTYFRLTTR